MNALSLRQAKAEDLTNPHPEPAQSIKMMMFCNKAKKFEVESENISVNKYFSCPLSVKILYLI
jgi:hypothetical protein